MYRFPMKVHVLSIDVTHSPEKGDLTQTHVIDFWLSLIAEGHVVGVLGGPPCETWSAARHLPCEGTSNPPRPVRSPSSLWGLPYLTTREGVQVGLGNSLLRSDAGHRVDSPVFVLMKWMSSSSASQSSSIEVSLSGTLVGFVMAPSLEIFA